MTWLMRIGDALGQKNNLRHYVPVLAEECIYPDRLYGHCPGRLFLIFFLDTHMGQPSRQSEPDSGHLPTPDLIADKKALVWPAPVSTGECSPGDFLILLPTTDDALNPVSLHYPQAVPQALADLSVHLSLTSRLHPAPKVWWWW